MNWLKSIIAKLNQLYARLVTQMSILSRIELGVDNNAKLLHSILDILNEAPPYPAIRIVPTLGVFTEQRAPVVKTPELFGTLKGDLLMAFSMTDSQQNTVSLKPVDKKGNAATVDGVPEWSTDNTDVLALTPAADGLSCLVAAVGPLGSGSITVKADGKAGPDEFPIVGTVDVTITGGDAVTIELTPGTPEEQPEAPATP